MSLILSELVDEGLIVRTGRGTYAFFEKPAPVVSQETLPDTSRRLYHALETKGLQFALSCLDILADYTHLVLRRFPHFCWVAGGSEDWAMEVAEEAGFTSLREPRRAQLSIALELSSADDLAIMRNTSIFYAAGLCLRRRCRRGGVTAA